MSNTSYVIQDGAELQPCSSPFTGIAPPLGDAVQADISLGQTLQELQVENSILRNGVAHLKVVLLLISSAMLNDC